jgi:hypothetical protein
MFIISGLGEHQVRVLMKTAQGYDIHRHLCALVTIKSSFVDDPILHRPYLTIIHLFRSADEHFFLKLCQMTWMMTRRKL